MEAACAGVAQNASQSAASAEKNLIARKLPAPGGGFKANGFFKIPVAKQLISGGNRF
jgi:hypothetical protein